MERIRRDAVAWERALSQVNMVRQGIPQQVTRFQLGGFILAAMGPEDQQTHVYIARTAGERDGEGGVFPIAEVEAVLNAYFNGAF